MGSWVQSDVVSAVGGGRIAERIMLAAHAYGIGSRIRMLSRESRGAAQKILGIPADRIVRTTISLGYPGEGAHRGGRRQAPGGRLAQRRVRANSFLRHASGAEC